MNCCALSVFLAFEERRHQPAQTIASIFHRLASFDGGEAGFGARAILHRADIQRENFFFRAPFHAFVKALSCFVAKPIALQHFFDKAWNFVVILATRRSARSRRYC